MLSTENGGNESALTQMLPALFVLMGIVIMMVLWMRAIRDRATRAEARRESPREQIDRIKAAHEARDAEQSLSADFVSSAQEIAARIDNKCERLEQLLAQADERIARLQELSSAGDREPRHQPQHQTNRGSADPLTRSVYELADAGRSPVEIAGQLDEQVGKVELILALRAGNA